MPSPNRFERITKALLGPTPFQLSGKVVLITGGARGLGIELTRRFIAEGARVAICARTEADIESAIRDLGCRDADQCLLGLVCDVTAPGAFAALVEDVVAHWGHVDVLVNNAGVILVGPANQMERADFETAMATHFFAPLDGIRAALPHLRAAGGGRIVNIASVGGKIAVPHLLPYCASKFALSGLSAGFRSELAKENIFVTGVHPGLMRTGSPVNASFKGKRQLEYAWFAISDSLPFLSMSAARAAAQIVKATKAGKAEIVLSLPAKVGVLLRALAPNLMSRLLAVVDELLPGEGGDGATHFGFESESLAVPSVLTTLTQRAEKRNNEVVHRRSFEAVKSTAS